MQALIAIPDFETLRRYGGAEQSLMREVSGIPLLVRIIKTAIRAGVDSLVVIWPSSVPLKIWLDCQAALLREGINGITIVQQERFAPWLTSSWAGILVTSRGPVCLAPVELGDPQEGAPESAMRGGVAGNLEHTDLD
jgi:hypothetical protein